MQQAIVVTLLLVAASHALATAGSGNARSFSAWRIPAALRATGVTVFAEEAKSPAGTAPAENPSVISTPSGPLRLG